MFLNIPNQILIQLVTLTLSKNKDSSKKVFSNHSLMELKMTKKADFKKTFFVTYFILALCQKHS